MHFSYGSLCTGYDGLGMALTLAGLKLNPVWHAESDPAPARVLEREIPGVPNLGDIKKVPWHLAPHTDLVTSGDPCQSISIAGRQAGRADPRFLWPWVRDAYRLVQPGAIFFENVANIVSHDGGRTLAERFEHLRADGYRVRWTVLGACAVGAPHHRHRWYAVARYVGQGAPAAERIGTKQICGAPRTGGRFVLPSPAARDGDGRGEGDERFWAHRREVLGRTNGMTLGAAVALLPTPITSDATGPGNTDGRTPDLRTTVARMLPTPTTSNVYGNDVNNRGELLLPGVAKHPEVWGRYADAIALWEDITGVPAPAPTQLGPKGSPRLSAALPEWMMGLRPGLLTDHLLRSDALRAAGNGVVPLAAAAAWDLLDGGNSPGTGRFQPAVR